ncbi:MAG: oligopeptide transporter, OPT family [Candidatus Zixiibacteriota bacterium]|nr:MAG: oligopeptide transporter, OPT family [candidate division Zixibacteria bacterium]
MPANNQKNSDFMPYISSGQSIAEVTIKAIVLGSILSVVFGVANAYIGLNYGMTISASIPAAVISMAILRTLFRRKRVTVLENNIVQTVGSAGESLAAGIIFTIPAFFIWAANAELAAQGYDHVVSKNQIFFLSMLGGGLGILLMIPLRKYLVDKEHGKLAFPEGTACAEIIVAGDEGGSKAKTVFLGIGIGAVYKLLFYTSRLWSESPGYDFKRFLKGGTVGVDATPVLMGVGYIIGPRIAALMLSGAVLGYLGIGPLLSFIGDQIPGIIISPGTIPLSEMNPAELRDSYIKYLGVGAVAVGGFVSLAKSLPVIFHSFSAGARELFSRRASIEDKPRTDRDLPMSWVLIGSLLIIIAIWAYPGTELHFMGALLAVIFGFFFVVVAARIVGIVGSSSSPVSGMTIATLLVTCLILISFGVSGVKGMVTAMSVGAVVCIAVCMSGDIAQDLKTGFLLGATPRKMQLTEFIGLLFPAIAMGFTLYLLGDAFGFVKTEATPNPLLAPQANVMATVVQGVMNANIPWAPILVGGMIAVAIELLGIQSLPFAIGLYLPLSLSTPIMIGGIIALLIKKSNKDKILVNARHQMGILFGSGLVAGDAIIGVITAGAIVGSERFSTGGYRDFFEAHEPMTGSLTGAFGPYLSLAVFVGLAVLFYFVARAFGKKLS